MMNEEFYIITGPMFSGKSTRLLSIVEKYTYARKKCIIVKYARDTRYEKSITHAGHEIKNTTISAQLLADVHDILMEYDVIAVDEIQFFQDSFEQINKLLNAGKKVIVAGLDSTFEAKPFPHLVNLISICGNITKLHAVCMICYADATMTWRTSAEKEIEVIGGKDKYIAVCRKCYYEQKN